MLLDPWSRRGVGVENVVSDDIKLRFGFYTLLPSAMTNRAFVGTATLVIPEPGAK